MANPADLRSRAQALTWYHTIDLGGGVVTNGYVDTRDLADRVLLPDSLRGRRCLDVGTQNGFWAFQLEKRGAESVTGIDLPSTREVDWPPRTLLDPTMQLDDERAAHHAAFELAKEALGSKAEWKGVSVYALDPEVHGTFDFAFMGSLLLHLRDPVAALDRIRRVCTGEAVFFDCVTVLESFIFRKTPRARLEGMNMSWWTPNRAGLSRMITAAGWDILEVSPMRFVKRGGLLPRPTLRETLQGNIDAMVIRYRGSPHTAFRVRPHG